MLRHNTSVTLRNLGVVVVNLGRTTDSLRPAGHPDRGEALWLHASRGLTCEAVARVRTVLCFMSPPSSYRVFVPPCTRS